MSNLLSYRAGTLEDPGLPWGRIAECGVQGIEMVWSDGLTAEAASAAAGAARPSRDPPWE